MEDMAHPSLMLSRLSLTVQEVALSGQFLDHFSPFGDGYVTPLVIHHLANVSCPFLRFKRTSLRLI